MSFISKLVYARRGPLGRLSREVLALYGVEVPAEVEIGRNLQIMHRGFGTVIHPHTTIGDDVTIYQGVTIGRGDPWRSASESEMLGVVIEDGVTICAGAVIVCTRGTLTIGAGSIIGANAVLTRSTGADEVWAGIPARKVRDIRDVGKVPRIETQ